MSDVVDLTLKRWRRTRFRWGAHDCILSLNDYLVSRGGQDVAAPFRGTYRDEAGARAILEAHGGLQGVIELAGLTRIDPDNAARGDIVLIDPARDGEQLGAICTGLGIAARGELTVIELNRRHVKIIHAWKVEQ